MNQQRNYRNEFIVAFVIVLVLGIGLLSATFLSDSDTSVTVSQDSTATSSNLTNEDVTSSPSDEEVTVTVASTDLPTETPEEDDDDEATATVNDEPIITETTEESDIDEDEVEITSTSTRRPTRTPSPTATHTSTNTPSPTYTPSSTNTATPTNTNTPTATHTPTYTPTNTITPSPTPIPTGESGILPTATVPLELVNITLVPTLTPATCGQPTSWVEYEVQSGDTLFAIAVASESTLNELRDVNCLADVNRITAGDIIFVPQEPSSDIIDDIVEQSTASTNSSNINEQASCNTQVNISSPNQQQTVTDDIAIFGTADIDDFWYYKLEVRPDFSDVYNFYSESMTVVRNGNLGTINTDLFTDGLHWIRLTVVNLGGGVTDATVCEIAVIFD